MLARAGKDVGLSMADTAQPHQISDIGELIDRKSRLGQIVHWLKGGRGSPLIIFDECHKVGLLAPRHLPVCWMVCIPVLWVPSLLSSVPPSASCMSSEAGCIFLMSRFLVWGHLGEAAALESEPRQLLMSRAAGMVAVCLSAAPKQALGVGSRLNSWTSVPALSGCADGCSLCRPRTCSQLQVGSPQLLA